MDASWVPVILVAVVVELLVEGGTSKVEKSQHSVSGARTRSYQHAANEEVGAAPGENVARAEACGEEVWNWRRRSRGRLDGRRGRR